MKSWIALLRGINVGGKNKLPMADLKAILQALQCSEIETYIQSGNAIFRTEDKRSAAQLSESIAAVVEARFGFAPHIAMLSSEEFRSCAGLNPYASVVSADEGKAVHLFFLDGEPAAPDLTKLDALKLPGESFLLKGKCFYLHTPDKFHLSKVAVKAEKLLNVQATARNWRTVTKLMEMLGDG